MKSNSKIAYNYIKKRILLCDYAPGQLLSEKEIVGELKMSRTPVRQALNRLAGENLITIILKKGILISHVSEAKMKEISEIRTILEKLIMEKAINNITEKDFVTLRQLHKKLIEDLEIADALGVFNAGNNIHLFISQIAENETLTNILKSLRVESSRGYVYFLRNKFERGSKEQIDNIKNSLKCSHEDILEALIEKNERKALKAIERDVNLFNEFI